MKEQKYELIESENTQSTNFVPLEREVKVDFRNAVKTTLFGGLIGAMATFGAMAYSYNTADMQRSLDSTQIEMRESNQEIMGKLNQIYQTLERLEADYQNK